MDHSFINGDIVTPDGIDIGHIANTGQGVELSDVLGDTIIHSQFAGDIEQIVDSHGVELGSMTHNGDILLHGHEPEHTEVDPFHNMSIVNDLHPADTIHLNHSTPDTTNVTDSTNHIIAVVRKNFGV